MGGKQAFLITVLATNLLAVAGCGRSPSEQGFATTAKSLTQNLEIVEIVARQASSADAVPMRPTFPDDVIEIAIRTQGRTTGADLSVKMIALADGSAVGSRDVRLNATSAAAPRVQFAPSPAWKPGRYLFEVSLDGKLAGTQELEIFPAEMAQSAQP